MPRAGWQCDIELAIDAVLANDGDRPRVDVFDGGDVDAERILRLPRLLRGGTKLAGQPMPVSSSGTGTSAWQPRRRPGGGSETPPPTMTPSVPSEPMNRSTRSMSGCKK